jgi:ribosomal protein S6 kinase alpha-5
LKDVNAAQGLTIQQLKSEINKLKAQSEQRVQCPVSLGFSERFVYLRQGGYGKVYLVLRKIGVDRGTLYAMKVLNKASACERITTEQHVFQKTGISPFLVETRYVFRVDSILHLVT